MKQFFPYIFIAFVSLASCEKDNPDIVFTGGTTNSDKPGTTPPSETDYKPMGIEAHLEVPRRDPANKFVAHFTTEGGRQNMTYCLEYSPTALHSRWVAYRYDAVTRGIATGRSDAWADDPLLPASLQIGTAYFPGFSRGHLVGSAERVYSVAANEQTFYMSNMSPQDSKFNTGLWGNMETIVRDKWGACCHICRHSLCRKRRYHCRWANPHHH